MNYNKLISEINSLRSELQQAVFAAFPDPKDKVRNKWRVITRTMANIKEEGYIGGESGVSESALVDARNFLIGLKRGLENA